MHRHRFQTRFAVRRLLRTANVTAAQREQLEAVLDSREALDTLAEQLTNEHETLHAGKVTDFLSWLLENAPKIIALVASLMVLFAGNKDA